LKSSNQNNFSVGNEQPIVWIIIPTFNRGNDLLECIQSIKNQNYTNYRIVIIDNNSQDNTRVLLNNQYSDLHIIHLDSNRGASAATNIGINYALSKNANLVLRLDSDTILGNSYLEMLVDVLIKTKNAGIASGKILSYDKPEEIWFTGGFLKKWNLGATYIDPHKHINDLGNSIIEVDLLPSTGMLITREAIELTNGFDEDFLVYYEDFDFCLRVKKNGLKLFCVTDAKIWHKVFSQKKTAWIARQWNKSRMVFYRKQAMNSFHKYFLFIYSFCYAIFRSIFKSENHGNMGPLFPAIKGLIDGLFVDISKPNSK